MEADIADNFPHKELTIKLIGAMYKVQNFLGNSLEERYYHRALQSEFTELGFTWDSEREIDLLYKSEKIGKHRLDFVIENKVIIEIKTTPFWIPSRQCNYLVT